MGCTDRSRTKKSVNFTTRASKVLVVVEGFPESEQGLVARLGTSVEQNANLGIENATESGEQPSVRVDLLGVLLLQTEHHLDGRKRAGAVVVGTDELLVRCNGQLSGVLELILVRNSQKIVACGWLTM